jgi:hypothetical protein
MGYELAGMLAHAIGHIVARDRTRTATRADLINSTMPVVYKCCKLSAHPQNPGI